MGRPGEVRRKKQAEIKGVSNGETKQATIA
jgi:hypothetical protein